MHVVDFGLHGVVSTVLSVELAVSAMLNTWIVCVTKCRKKIHGALCTISTVKM